VQEGFSLYDKITGQNIPQANEDDSDEESSSEEPEEKE
jgi:hypothetical protein